MVEFQVFKEESEEASWLWALPAFLGSEEKGRGCPSVCPIPPVCPVPEQSLAAAFISAGGGGLRSLTSEHTLYPQSKLPVMWETPVQATTSLDPHALRISTS